MAKDDDLATQILAGTLEKYTWSINREAENKWTCDVGSGPKVLKDFTDPYGLEVVSVLTSHIQSFLNGPDTTHPPAPRHREQETMYDM